MPTRHLLLSCLLLPLALAASEAPSWPCWRGADGSGAAPDCPPLVSDLSQARLVWVSEERRLPSSYGFIAGGCGGPVVADGRVYLTYQWPSGELDQAYYDKNAEVPDKKAGALQAMAEAFAMTAEEVLRTKCLSGADDVVLCLDASTGKTLWRKVYPGAAENVSRSGRGAWKWNKTGPHNVPAVAYGKVVAIGGAGEVACLDAASGEEHWRLPLVGYKPGSRNNGCATFAAGLFVLGKGSACIGVDPASGQVRWEVGDCLSGITNPIRWLPGGDREYIIAGATCIDPRDGRILWKAEGAAVGSITAPAVDASYLVYGGDDKAGVGLNAWRITPQGAEQAWTLPAECAAQNYCAPVIMDGHAYCKNADPANRGQSRWLCVELATGTMKASPSTRTDACASLIGGGGRLFYEHIVIDADPASLAISTSGDWAPGDNPDVYARSHTPCLVGGLLFVRGQNAVRCFDLRRK